MSAGVSLEGLVRAGARSFLQTVLVIDNELEMAAPGPRGPAPRMSNPRPGASGGKRPAETAPAPSEIPGAAPPSAPRATSAEAAIAEAPVVGGDVSALNVKTIMDAFLRRSLICGMHRPEGKDDLVREAITAARRSDAVIVDWLLSGSDPTPAKNIIAGILAGDREDHGRLRLIVVYTSNPRAEDIAREILEHAEGSALANLGGGVLTGSDTRIVVLNKAGTPTARETVSVEDLPERIIDEFGRLSDGILSTFAVTAVAAVRRATHHVLAVFSSELDGAMIAHRCALKTPDDATEFALELLAGEFKGAITRSGEATKVLAATPLMEWIGRRERDGMIGTSEVRIRADAVKAFAVEGENAILNSIQEWVPAPDGTKPKGGLGQKRITPRTIGLLFHDGEARFKAAHHRFASLAQFKNEPYGRRAPRGHWRPMLTLGTLLVALEKTGDAVTDRYLLCTQPRCDAVRIGEVRHYPFQLGAAVPHDAFNVVATRPAASGTGLETVTLAVDMKPFNTTMIEFAATGDERVVAEEKGSSFYFTDTAGGRYLWLGDLRDLTAQRTAGKVAARLHDVGFDEFEWSRRHALEKPPTAKDPAAGTKDKGVPTAPKDPAAGTRGKDAPDEPKDPAAGPRGEVPPNAPEMPPVGPPGLKDVGNA